MSNVIFSKNIPIMPGMSAYLPTIIKQANKQTSMSSATTKDIYIDDDGNTILTIPRGFMVRGCTFRAIMGGTKSGTNAAMTLAVILGGTTVSTMTADDTSAVDWVAEVILSAKTLAVQNCLCRFLSDTADPDIQYDAGAVDTSQGTTLKFQLGGNSSDTVTCEYFLLEYWQVPAPTGAQ